MTARWSGGVNAICSPTTNILTCKLKALSPNGHSRAFDAAADGYLRGEGCGVVALRRLSDAQRDGDPILGIIRGSAIGHNGFSSGLTAPNPKARKKSFARRSSGPASPPRSRLSRSPRHRHRTWRSDRDAGCRGRVDSERAADDPLLVGSVKTNIGHLEAAAGMAGLIKVLLAIETQQDSRSAEFRESQSAHRLGQNPRQSVDGGRPTGPTRNDGLPASARSA